MNPYRAMHGTPERAEEERRYREYLDTFSTGDVIKFVTSYGFGQVAISSLKFDRQTATQLIFTDGRGAERRFRKKDGHAIGTSYAYLPYPADIEELAKAKSNIIMQGAAHRFEGLAKGSLTTDEAETIDAILKSAEERTKALSKGR